MEENKIEFVSDVNIKLLDFLKIQINGASNKTIKNYIKYEMVLVNGIVVTNPNSILKINDRVSLYFKKRKIPKIDVKIIYEDDDLIAIDKPSGLLSISNSREKERTAFRIVSDYIKSGNKDAHLFVVHRLDEQTSGVLLFAKNENIKRQLQNNWNELVKLREYICVVKGKTPLKGKIESYLTMNHFQIVHSTSNKEIGHYAVTYYERIKFNNSYSLLRVKIDTGRRNQIRVHLSEKGFPIVGDKKYGSSIKNSGRLALHASKLEIVDPRSENLLRLSAPVPEEIVSLVD